MTPTSRASIALLTLLGTAACDGCGSPRERTPLTDPNLANERAPDVFVATFETTKGAFSVECRREWAPHGVDRFYNLVKIGFFDGVAFFRVVKSPAPFVAQFGIHGDPKIASRWVNANLAPDEPKTSNVRGTLAFAMADKPDTRTTQVFVNLGNNARLDRMGFSPICKVIGEGMAVADALEGKYGDSPDQGAIQSKGNAYLKESFPDLDTIKRAHIEEAAAAPASSSP